MGGSGGGGPIIGKGGTGASGGGGDRGIQEINCPRKFETMLVDVFQAGNSAFALTLPPGTSLSVEIAPNGGVAVQYQKTVIGYLPPQYDSVSECIANGWNYSATVLEVKGDKAAPRIKVMIIGAS